MLFFKVCTNIENNYSVNIKISISVISENNIKTNIILVALMVFKLALSICMYLFAYCFFLIENFKDKILYTFRHYK